MMKDQRTVFEKSQKGQRAYSLPKSCAEFEAFKAPDMHVRKEEIDLPELSELDLTRHFVGLSTKNKGIDNHFYPLGSCTMKLNPRSCEQVAAMPGFQRIHPLAPVESVQGCLKVLYEFGQMLCQVCSMSSATFASNAGAQGEFVGIQMISAYHQERGDTERVEMLIPDNAHGTNPASANMGGLKSVSIRSNDQGDIDIDHLRSLLSDKTAGLMLTNPNTLGLFSPQVEEIAKLVHEAGGLLYYDGANLNAIMNIIGPGDMGFDVMHINLHKTFSTPHGGGGPGAGPVLCNKRLEKYLPLPRVSHEDGKYAVQWSDEFSIGQLTSFFGNFAIVLRAYFYTILHGHYGLRRIAENAVLNANYLKTRLSKMLKCPFPQYCMHEFVIQADTFLDKQVKALDIAKRMLDYGVHSPTVYFPLIIRECMLIEPTETESKATLDHFVEIFESIIKEIEEDTDLVRSAPLSTLVSRLDEVKAVRNPILRHRSSVIENEVSKSCSVTSST